MYLEYHTYNMDDTPLLDVLETTLETRFVRHFSVTSWRLTPPTAYVIGQDQLRFASCDERSHHAKKDYCIPTFGVYEADTLSDHNFLES